MSWSAKHKAAGGSSQFHATVVSQFASAAIPVETYSQPETQTETLPTRLVDGGREQNGHYSSERVTASAQSIPYRSGSPGKTHVSAMTDETAATNAAGEPITPEPQVAESAPAGSDPAATPDKPNGMSARIDELTRSWRDEERARQNVERDRDYWREQALRAQPPRETPKPAEPAQAKTLADFEYDEAKFQNYVLDQAEQRAVSAAERRLQERQEAETRERRIQKHQERVSEFEKANPTYREKIRSGIFSDAMAEVITESDEGPAVAFYLANNLTLAEQISRLPPLAAARELGRIEAKLIGAREQAARKVSEAPPPPPPKIEGAGDPKIEKDPREMTDAEFDKWRRKQIAQRR